MIKRFAPLAMLFGLLTALLLGSTATAQATTLLDFDCNNVGLVNVVVCENDIVEDVTVTIKNTRVLNNNELLTLENVLNNIDIDVLNPTTYIGDVKLAALNVFNNTFNIPITVGDIKVCVGVLLCK